MIARATMRRGGFWLVLILAGVGLLGRDGYLRLKGVVAAELVDAALAAHLGDGRAHPPWRWADFQPVARLLAPRLGTSLPVLEGSVGQTMAFGLAHVGGTARPGRDDNVVLAGHRDSWARFMADLREGDLLVLEFAGGQRSYRVRTMVVLDCHETWILAQGGASLLTLVTCYPVGGLIPTTARFVVMAEPVAGGSRQG
jgi:sortase A